MKKSLIFALAVFATAGCMNNEAKQAEAEPTPVTASSSKAQSNAETTMAKAEAEVGEKVEEVAAAVTADTVKLLPIVAYSKRGRIDQKIKHECKIDRQLPEFIEMYALESGILAKRTPKAKNLDDGRVLEVEITEAISRGNAWIGHRKYTQIRGTLYQDGKKVSSFAAARRSGGGAFGGFKGSCSVMGRTVKALGKDVAQWLGNPYDDARLGDL